MEIDWSDEAIDALDGLMEGLGYRSPAYAIKVQQELFARVQQLADFPWSGRMVPEYGEQNFRELIAPPYRVMYRIRTNGITIEAIAHSSWDFR